MGVSPKWVKSKKTEKKKKEKERKLVIAMAKLRMAHLWRTQAAWAKINKLFIHTIVYFVLDQMSYNNRSIISNISALNGGALRAANLTRALASQNIIQSRQHGYEFATAAVIVPQITNKDKTGICVD